MTALTGPTERLVVARVELDAIFMEIADDVEMTAPTGPAERLVIARVELDAILMQITDDVEVTALTRPAEGFIVANPQINTTLMEPQDRIQIALVGCVADRLIRRFVFPVKNRRRRNAIPRTGPGRHGL